MGDFDHISPKTIGNVPKSNNTIPEIPPEIGINKREKAVIVLLPLIAPYFRAIMR